MKPVVIFVTLIFLIIFSSIKVYTVKKEPQVELSKKKITTEQLRENSDKQKRKKNVLLENKFTEQKKIYLNSTEFLNFQKKIIKDAQIQNSQNKNNIKSFLIDRDIFNIEEVSFEKLYNNSSLEDKTIFSDASKIFENNFYGLQQYGILYESSKNNKNKLLIIITGSGDSAYSKYTQFQEIKSKYLELDHDVLVLSSYGQGFNRKWEYSMNKIPIKLKDKIHSFTSDILLPLNHEKNRTHVYKNFYNEKNNITSGIPILVSGNYYLIENIIDEYNTIELLGHSLGGLTALIISSMNEKVEKTYIFSGGLPKEYTYLSKLNNIIFYDDDFYNYFNYWDLYFIIAKNDRKLSLIYNSDDKVAFNNPEAKHLITNINKIKNKNLKGYLFDDSSHLISTKEILSLINN